MPDKYSYKSSKKKKSNRRSIIAQPVPTEAETEAELTGVTDFHPIVETKSTTTAGPAMATKPSAYPGESRGISRVSNLGAELRRLAIIAVLILIVLVGSALVLR